MAETLKEGNRASLVLVLSLNLALFYGAVTFDDLLGLNWNAPLDQIGKAIPAGFLLLASTLLNAQFSADAKARIIFMRWRNPYPGSFAFSKYCEQDPRIDRSKLEALYGELPAEPMAQNRLWYKIYRSVEADPRVLSVHKDFLLARDLNSLSLIMTLTLGGIGLFYIPTRETLVWYLLVLLAQFAITGQAARTLGKRMVCTVLALKSIG